MYRNRYIRWVLAGGFPITSTAVVLVLTLMFRSDQDVSLSRLVTLVLISGVAAMILIETVKRLVPVRALFQRRLVYQSLYPQSPLSEVLRDTGHPGGPISQLRERAEIGGIFNLPTEQLIPQLAAAARMTAFQDSHQYYDSKAEETYHARSIEEWEERLARDLDRLQVRLSGRWRHYIRATAVWLSGSIALVLTSIHVSEIPDSRSIPITALIFGGFIAWLARDITAAIERMRR